MARARKVRHSPTTSWHRLRPRSARMGGENWQSNSKRHPSNKTWLFPRETGANHDYVSKFSSAAMFGPPPFCDARSGVARRQNSDRPELGPPPEPSRASTWLLYASLYCILSWLVIRTWGVKYHSLGFMECDMVWFIHVKWLTLWSWWWIIGIWCAVLVFVVTLSRPDNHRVHCSDWLGRVTLVLVHDVFASMT